MMGHPYVKESWFFILLGIFFSCLNLPFSAKGQGCCAGGSGSPVAGGLTQGVLADRQAEIGSSFQYFQSNKFMVENRDTTQFYDNFNSRYLYSRIAYGLTRELTLSIESGYFLNKTQTMFYDSVSQTTEILETKGASDLIIFPRYAVFSHNGEKHRFEITTGLGWKIPLGSHTDSTIVFTNPISGVSYYSISPPLLQTTTGSHDFIFYGFLFDGIPKRNWSFFSNLLYVKKGWNSLGIKAGDYYSASMFVSKGLLNNTLNISLQTKWEQAFPFQTARNINPIAMYNMDPLSSGTKMFSILPQCSYRYKSMIAYFMYEIPVYQYVVGSQLAFQQQITSGVFWRFLCYKVGKIEEKL